jgi:UDP-N-acetylglucosamine 2-epimerase (non-hydrolysing)
MTSPLVAPHVSVVVGARPNFVKVARLIPALRDQGLTTRLIHTGQHYDERMSRAFFEVVAASRGAGCRRR